MTTIQIIQAITILLSVLSGFLAWGAKLFWSREYAAAKDEIVNAKKAQIEAKDALISVKDSINIATQEIVKSKDAHIATLEREIKSLQEMTPMKIREYFVSVKEQLEEYNEDLKQKLQKASEEVEAKNKAIKQLESSGTHVQGELIKLKKERDTLIKQTKEMELHIPDVNIHTYVDKLMNIKIPQLDVLENLKTYDWSKAIQDIDFTQFTKFDDAIKNAQLTIESPTFKTISPKKEP